MSTPQPAVHPVPATPPTPPTSRQTPQVPGWPLVGAAPAMMKDPARFFLHCYRKYGPVFRLELLGNRYVTIAGPEAANFLNTKEGKESLRSKEFWQGLVDEYGATRTLTGEDGETHKQLREVMKRGYTKEAIKGRYGELVAIADRAMARDWRPGTKVPVVQSFQYMVVEQLGSMLTGTAPLEYVDDIRTVILHILNVLVTRQRPKLLLRRPQYKRAKLRVFELGNALIDTSRRRYGKVPDGEKNLLDDIYAAHVERPELVPANDLILSMVGPYVAGLDTVANTTGAILYTVLKHPEVRARVLAEVDAFFAEVEAAGGLIDEDGLFKRLPALNGAVMETMRLYPIAVAQMRTATRDFTFEGHLIREGEMIYIATSVPHFMAEFFPEPDRFDIDRYQKPRAEHLKPGAYSPYGRGPHTCLGKSLAEVQILLTMARVFHRLDLALDPEGYVLRTKTAPTPGPAMNFRVKVKGLRHPGKRAPSDAL